MLPSSACIGAGRDESTDQSQGKGKKECLWYSPSVCLAKGKEDSMISSFALRFPLPSDELLYDIITPNRLISPISTTPRPINMIIRYSFSFPFDVLVCYRPILYLCWLWCLKYKVADSATPGGGPV